MSDDVNDIDVVYFDAATAASIMASKHPVADLNAAMVASGGPQLSNTTIYANPGDPYGGGQVVTSTVLRLYVVIMNELDSNVLRTGDLDIAHGYLKTGEEALAESRKKGISVHAPSPEIQAKVDTFIKKVSVDGAELGRLLEAILAARRRTDLAGQADFAEGQRVRAQGAVAKARMHRQQHRQIGRGLADADAADDVDEYVLVVDRHTAMAVRHRQQQRQSIAFVAHGHAARIGQRTLVDQRLHLDQQRPRAFLGDQHAGTGNIGPVL